MKKVLVTVPFSAKQKERIISEFQGAEVDFMNPEDVTAKQLGKYNALVGNLPVSILKDMNNLEWIQLNSSGADAYAKLGAVPLDTVLTCSTGAYGLGISEYMVGMLMVMMKKIPAYLDSQKTGVWSDHGQVESPFGKRVLLVGTGNIGLEFAKRMRAFGCELVGIRNRVNICPQEFDAVYGVEDLQKQVRIADVIAVSLPGTEKSFHMFNKEILMACKKGSYFMNVGRGTAIDNQALLEKEVYENFGGIWLDVCETEPLPDGDPLYKIPGMLITPHITGGFHLEKTVDNILDIAVTNFNAWMGAGEFIHSVSRKDGYSLK